MAVGFIYVVDNDINNKKYVGKTEDSVEARWAEHCRDYKKERNEKRPFYSAMRKHGVENFHPRLVEECDISILAEREKYWIQYYDSFENGYNATLGGDGTHYIDYDVVVKYYLEGYNQAEIARMMNIDKGTVHNALKANKIQSRDAKTVMQAALGMAVKQYDKDGHYIRTFPSALNAAESLGKADGKSNGAASHITDVCKGKRKKAYGYIWKFVEDNQEVA